MKRLIRLHDMYSGASIAQHRDSYLRLLDANAEAVSGLRVKIRATNSGCIVNGRVYKGIHMREAVDTWLKPYPRPILVHHADGGGMFGPDPVDPKGRVESAEFIQVRKGRGFENDWKSPAKDGGMGSGYIEVIANITDADAIQKILDGRYLTVSSSQTTNEMTCSICGQDWFKDYCEHSPGNTYEIEVGKGKNKKTREYFCYGICGPLVYRELSFVNVPAQVNAQVLGVLEPDAQDNLNMLSYSRDNAVMGMALCDAEGNIITDLMNEKDLEMGKEKKVIVGVPSDLDAEDQDDLEDQADDNADDDNQNVDEPTPESQDDDADDKDEPVEPATADSDDSDDDSQDSEVGMSDRDFAIAFTAKSIKDNGLWLGKDESSLVFDGETESVEIDGVTHSHLAVLQKTEDGKIVGRTYATIGDAEDHDHVIEGDFLNEGVAKGESRDASGGANHTHTFELAEDEDELDDEVIESLVKELEADSEEAPKLSAAQREKLEGKDFCGPNHSFPVSDEEHVIAARTLIPRYKSDAATKARVMSSVERKADKMGCGGGKKKKKKKKKKAKMDNLQHGVSMSAYRDEAFEETLLDLATFRHKVGVLEASLTEKSQEVQALEDELVREKAARGTALANTLAIIRTILGKPDCVSVDSHDKFKEKVESYAKRTPDSLWDAVSDLLPEVDLAVRNVRKIKDNVVVEGKVEPKVKAHKDLTNRGTKKTRGNPKRKADQLRQDLDS